MGEPLGTSPRLEGWQPIETAPKDGTAILVFLPTPHFNSRLHVATFHPNLRVVGGIFEFDLPAKPTHWMPLPPPPQANEVSGS